MTALRVAIVNPATIDCLFNAAWIDDIDFNDINAIINVLNLAGFDGKQLVDQANTDAPKQQLSKNTDYALSKNVFGCPTYLYNNHLLFGGDRVNSLLDLIYGFDPQLPISSDKWPLKKSPAQSNDSKL